MVTGQKQENTSTAKNIKSETKEKDKVHSHRRTDSDTKMSKPFFRAFRRENSDFFPISNNSSSSNNNVRHSAIYSGEKVARPNGGGMFNNRRGSDVGMINKKKSDEPVLMDYIKRNESPSSTNKLSNMRPRREKTESDIVLRHSEVRRSIRESLEARRREVEQQFAKDVESIRRKKMRPVETNSIALSTATNSIVDTEEYLFIQVNLCFILYLVFLRGCF